MKVFIDAVTNFMKAKKLPINQPMVQTMHETLQITGETLIGLAAELEGLRMVDSDLRVLRMQGLVEELGELCCGMAGGDEVESLDALADLMYFAIGTAVSFDWPIESAFSAVHKSNMTKAISDSRLREKGDFYQPPNIKELLEHHKAEQARKAVKS